MAAAAPLMPAHHHGARVHMRNLLEEACERLLQRLREEELPPEEEELPACDGVRCSAAQIEKSVSSLEAPRDPQEVARLLSLSCCCDLLPPGVLEVLAQKLTDPKRWLSSECWKVAEDLQKVLLREEKLAAFFADDWSLSQSLLPEIRGLLRGRHWDRLRIQRGYLAEFTTHPEVQVHQTPQVQLSTGDANTAEPEVHASPGDEMYTPTGRMSGPDPEVQAPAETKTKADAHPEVHASAAKRGQRVDLAIGDRKTELGFYIELNKNPKDKKTLQDGRDKLRAILSTESVSAPGNFNTTEEKRVCYQIIFYTPDQLAKGSQHPEEMEKLLSKQSSWMHVIDCYEKTWRLPKREVGACILEVKPDF